MRVINGEARLAQQTLESFIKRDDEAFLEGLTRMRERSRQRASQISLVRIPSKNNVVDSESFFDQQP